MRTSGEMILNVDLPYNGFCEIICTQVKYWAGEGLPTFEGSLATMKEVYPVEFSYLLKRKTIRVGKEF